MINLCIGIISGFFSSIIVSVVFSIRADYKDQVQRVQQRYENLHQFDGLFMFYELEVKPKDPADTIIQNLNETILKELKTVALNESRMYQSMIFDDLEQELHEIAISMNNFIDDIKRIETIDNDTIEKKKNELDIIIENFNSYLHKQRSILKKTIINNNTLRIFAIIAVLIVVSTLIIA